MVDGTAVNLHEAVLSYVDRSQSPVPEERAVHDLSEQGYTALDITTAITDLMAEGKLNRRPNRRLELTYQ